MKYVYFTENEIFVLKAYAVSAFRVNSGGSNARYYSNQLPIHHHIPGIKPVPVVSLHRA